MVRSTFKNVMVGSVVLLFFGLAFTSIIAPPNSVAEPYEEMSEKLTVMKAIGKSSFLESKINDDVNEQLLEHTIFRLMKLAHMSALSAAIVKEDEVAWAKGFGLYDRENNKLATENTIFLVASISKTVTATAIMQLYENGSFDLDGDVNEYLPFSLRNPNYPDTPITFRMLLAHRSSLATEPDYPKPTFIRMVPGGIEQEDYPDPFLREYLTYNGTLYTSQVWTDSLPGKEMHYANIGYAVIGYLVELISGQPFDMYCRKNIFEPLGMKNSSFRMQDLNVSRLAVPYDFQHGRYYPFMHYDTVDYPASGLRSSVMDLSRFLIAHMNGGVYNDVHILEEETVEQMHSPQYANGRRYGLGWQIQEKSMETYVGHSGGMHGVTTEMTFRESDNVGIIFFINERVWNYRERFAFSLIERLLFWKASNI